MTMLGQDESTCSGLKNGHELERVATIHRMLTTHDCKGGVYSQRSLFKLDSHREVLLPSGSSII